MASTPEHPPPTLHRRLGMRALTAWKSALVGLGVFCLLGSGSLVQSARGQEDGVVRDVSLGAARAVDRVSNFLSLNRPLDWVNGALGRETEEPTLVFPPATIPPPPEATTTTVAPRIVTTDRPLRISVFGDSQALDLGRILKKAYDDDPLLAVSYDGRVSSGLARPDYYNWPARLQEQLARADADVVVLQFGANDVQALMAPNGTRVAKPGTPEWDAEYRRRMAGLMDVLKKEQRYAVWIGEPLVADARLNGVLQNVNRWAAEEAQVRPWMRYLDTSSLLAGPNGEYVDYLTPPGRAAIRCRQRDGIHLTADCVRLVADRIVELVRPLFPAAAPAPTTTTTAPPR